MSNVLLQTIVQLIAFQMMELGFTADQWLKISNVFAKIVYTRSVQINLCK